MEEQARNKLTLTNRRQLVFEGVRLVEKFDDEEIVLETNMGALFLKGNDLHITQLDLEKGTLLAEGFFTWLQFREESSGSRMKAKGKGILGKLFK
ncbi:MAG: sporulation protein YabP [Bacillota bacterium]